MGYVGWGLVAEQANTTTGGAQRTVGITSSPGAGIAQSSLNSVNNGGGGVVNNYGAVWDNLFVRQYLFGRGEQGAWFDPSDFQPNWRRNLLTYTEQFDNAAWAKTNVTVTANAVVAPDGTLTGDKLVETTATGLHYLPRNITLTATAHTYTIFAKAAERQFLRLNYNFTAYAAAFFNLATGTLTSGSGSGYLSASITDAGNGWYRCSLTFTGLASALDLGTLLENTSGNASYTGDGTSGIYIWGAQLEVGSTATAYQPITDGIVDYLTYQPQPILYQDSSGVTPVTALEQPCGLMLDKSKGLQLGPELVVNGDFSQGTTGWTGGFGGSTFAVVNGELEVTGSGGSFPAVRSDLFATVIGRSYLVTGVARRGTTASAVGFAVGLISATTSATSNTQVSFIFAATSTSTQVSALIASGTGTGTAYFDNISIRELSGNHAYQTTSAKRPVVSARVNLLTYTEQFDNAAWTKNNATVTANTVAAPDGTLTADTVTASAGAAFHYVNRTSVPFAAASHTYRFYIKKATSQWVFFTLLDTTINYFDLDSGLFGTNPDNCTAVNVGNGWWYITITKTTTTTANGCGIGVASGNNGANFTAVGTEAVYVWGADLRPADQATGIMPRYQRVGAATSGTSTAAGVADYDSVGFPVYLRTDGIDDAMLTNSIDFNTVTSDGLPRRNLLVNPTQFDAASWGKTDATVTPNVVVAPDGTTTADALVTTNTSNPNIQQSLVGPQTGVAFVFSFYARAGTISEVSGQLFVNSGLPVNVLTVTGAILSGPGVLNTGGATSGLIRVTGLSSTQWTRIALTGTSVSTSGDFTAYIKNRLSGATIGDTTYIWGAQLETGSTATAFQNIGTDKVTVFSGVRKLSDAVTGVVAEISVQAALNNGAFLLTAPGQNGASSYRFHSRGTVEAIAGAGVFAAAPDTAVLTGIGNISGDVATIRRNGSVVDTNTADQGTGNYGNYPLYLFARNQASNFFTGNFYGLIVRGAQTDTSLITTTEEYIANVTGFGAPVVVGTPSIGVSI